METGEKPSSNKVIVAVAMFFLLGFLINLFLNYSQTTALESRVPVGDAILKTSTENGQKLDELKKQLEVLEGKIKVLEDNSKKEQ